MHYGDQMIEGGWHSRLECFKRPARTVPHPNEDPDYSLVLRVREGHADAFHELVEKYKQPIVNFATRALGDPIEAQDVAQAAFVRVFKESRRFRFACKFSTWLYTIARNICRNELRRRLRHPARSLEPNDMEKPQFARWQLDAPKLGNLPEAVSQRELEEKVGESLASLPERERVAILLLHDDQLSYDEVAAILKTSRGATKMLIHRGRRTLKRELRPYLRMVS
jgi:RNA polymerase sigma-70 factor, ECF subfamily